ncbi:MAG TPA: response regulator, partial [Halococcus sp.]|nr:response regulator [Halococcus sp.]
MATTKYSSKQYFGMDDAIRVLCVDDDEALLDTTAAFIERDGLVALTETSAHAAIERLDETKIDCVVSDYQMPGMDGLELLAHVRESTPAMPFILFTGKGSEGIASEAISAGVTDYLQKGRTTGQYEVLINRIENAVAKRRAERDLQRTQSRYRRLAEQNLVGIYIVRDGRIQYANPKLAAIFGYDRDELVGLSPLSLVTSDCDLAAEVLASHEHGEQEEAHHTFTGRRRDGTTVEVEVHGGRVEYEGEAAIIGVCKDIDHRRRREYTLRALHDATGDLMSAHTKEAVAERAVAAAEDVLGFSVAVVRLYDPETDRLAPVATTDATTTLLGERPAFGPSEALPWRAFASAEPIVAGGDIETYGANDVPFESTLYVPLDGHGTLSIGSEAEEFTDSDIRLAQVLAANTAAAFDRVERESALERYET